MSFLVCKFPCGISLYKCISVLHELLSNSQCGRWMRNRIFNCCGLTWKLKRYINSSLASAQPPLFTSTMPNRRIVVAYIHSVFVAYLWFRSKEAAAIYSTLHCGRCNIELLQCGFTTYCNPLVWLLHTVLDSDSGLTITYHIEVHLSWLEFITAFIYDHSPGHHPQDHSPQRMLSCSWQRTMVSPGYMYIQCETWYYMNEQRAPRCWTLAPVYIVSGQPETADVDGKLWVIWHLCYCMVCIWVGPESGTDPTLTLQLSNSTIITLHAIVVLTIGEVNGRGAVQRSNIWR